MHNFFGGHASVGPFFFQDPIYHSILHTKMGRTGNYDISDIGQVAVRLDLDGDDYADYLADRSLEDSDEAKAMFIRDGYAEYEVELFDSVTYHSLGFDRMTIDGIEDFFGEPLARAVLRDCMDGEEHEYEPHLYADQEVDLSDPAQLSNAAMKCLPHGEYTRGARGFILPNGVVVYTPMEHNHCSRVPGVKGTFHFIGLGCIRVLEQGVDIAKPPTPRQLQTLSDVFNANYGREFYVDLQGGASGRMSRRYDSCDGGRIGRDIERYYRGGVSESRVRQIVRDAVLEAWRSRGQRGTF